MNTTKTIYQLLVIILAISNLHSILIDQIGSFICKINNETVDIYDQ